jgi:hypothetical protein
VQKFTYASVLWGHMKPIGPFTGTLLLCSTVSFGHWNLVSQKSDLLSLFFNQLIANWHQSGAGAGQPAQAVSDAGFGCIIGLEIFENGDDHTSFVDKSYVV